MPKRITEEDARWKPPRKIEPVQPQLKSREYAVTFPPDPATHKVFIILDNLGWYKGSVKFSKPLTRSDGAKRTGTDCMSKDISFVKDFIRTYLNEFGEYTITPV